MSTSDDARLDRIEDLLTDLIKTVNKFISSSGERLTRAEVEREGHTRDIADLRHRVIELERDRATTSALGSISKSLADLREDSIGRDEWEDLRADVRDIDERVESIEREGLVSKGKRMAYLAVAGAVGALAVGLFKGLAEAAIKLLT